MINNIVDTIARRWLASYNVIHSVTQL